MERSRARVWAFIAYPESIEWGDLVRRLERLHVPAAISPLHDKDEYTAEDELDNANCKAGTLKKPHWHVVLYFDSVKTESQVLRALEPLGIGYVEQVNSTRSYNRYLCHLDNPEKAQYSRDDVVRLTGAVCDMSEPDPTAERLDEIRFEIEAFVLDNGINEYSDLVRYAHDSGRIEWLRVIRHSTIHLNALIRSNRCKTGDDSF